MILSIIGRSTGAKIVHVDTLPQEGKTIVITENKYEVSNYTYVEKLMLSNLWPEIMERSQTINNDSQLNNLYKRPLKDLTVQELAALKKLCHDALKCVAVDYILNLQPRIIQTDNGTNNNKIMRALVSIIQVVTKLTSACHDVVYENVEEYSAKSEIFKAASVIVQDNVELCKIQVNSSDVNNNKDSYVAEANKTESAVQDTIDVNNTKNHVVTIVPHIVEDTADTIKEKSSKLDSNIVDKSATVDITNTGKPEANRISINNDSTGGSNDEINVNESQGNELSVKHKGDNRDGGDNTVETDIASSGSFTENHVGKGFVEDGYMNNGEMVVQDHNTGVNTKGIISESTADNGIINVGTVNNGATNYGTVRNFNISGLSMVADKLELASSINKIFSTLLTADNKM